jgi:hypothetical protein
MPQIGQTTHVNFGKSLSHILCLTGRSFLEQQLAAARFPSLSFCFSVSPSFSDRQRMFLTSITLEKKKENEFFLSFSSKPQMSAVHIFLLFLKRAHVHKENFQIYIFLPNLLVAPKEAKSGIERLLTKRSERTRVM